MGNHNHRNELALIAAGLLLFSGSAANAAEGELYENLETVEGAKAALVEIDPNADFGVYKRVALLDTQVAFRSGWERSQRKAGSRVGVSQDEIERIRTGVADLFQEVFTEVLEANDGYEIVDVAGEDVLLIRPAIIDLNISAPDTGGSFSSRTYSNNTGTATLYVELFDSVSGQILGRAADRQTIRNAGDRFYWTTSASNTADARRLLGEWAQALRNFLDTHYNGAE
jgi:hypothetical protein